MQIELHCIALRMNDLIGGYITLQYHFYVLRKAMLEENHNVEATIFQ